MEASALNGTREMRFPPHVLSLRGGGSKLAPLLMLVTLASRDFLALPVPQVKVENQVTR